MARAGLSTTVVVEEAARISDEEGYARLTLSAVAKRLGVTVPSLYKHVSGLDGLRGALHVRCSHEFAEVIGRAVLGRSGPEALRSLARAYRDYALRHPGRYAALQRAPDPDDPRGQAAAQSVLEVIIAVLRGFDLPQETMVDAIRAIRSALHGFVALEADGGFGLPQDVGHSFDVLVEMLLRSLLTWDTTAERTVR